MALKKVWVDLTKQPDGSYAGSASKTEGQGLAMYVTSIYGSEAGSREDMIDALASISYYATEHPDALLSQPTPLFFNTKLNYFFINILPISIQRAMPTNTSMFGTAGLANISQCYFKSTASTNTVARFLYNGNTIYVDTYVLTGISDTNIKAIPYYSKKFDTIASETTVEKNIPKTNQYMNITSKGYIKSIYRDENVTGADAFYYAIFININNKTITHADTTIVTRRYGTTYTAALNDRPSFISYGGINNALYVDLPEYNLTLPTTTDGSTFQKETVQELTPANITIPRVFNWYSNPNDYKIRAGFNGDQTAVIGVSDATNETFEGYAYEYIESQRNKFNASSGSYNSVHYLIPKYVLSVLNHRITGGVEGALQTVKFLTYGGQIYDGLSNLRIPHSDKYLYEVFKVGFYIQAQDAGSSYTFQINSDRITPTGTHVPLENYTFTMPSGNTTAVTYFELDADGINIRYKKIDYSTFPEIVAIQALSYNKNFAECTGLADGQILLPKTPTTNKLVNVDMGSGYADTYIILSPKT